MSYWEDRYIEYLGERAGQVGGDAWEDDYDPATSLRKALSGENKMPYDEVKCPECNGDMISRRGQYGIFWGCKAYPKCKGTRDSMGRSKAEREAEEKPKDRWSEERDDIPSSRPSRGVTTFNKKKESNSDT